MIRRPPRSTRTDTLFPYPTLFRSLGSRPDARGSICIAIAGFCVSGRSLRRQFYRHGNSQSASQLRGGGRSEEHTSELQSLMRISYAVFCLKKKNHNSKNTTKQQDK